MASQVSVDAIKAEVGKLEGYLKNLLLDLVRCPSLQGHEKTALDLMEQVFQEKLHMKTDRWNLDVEELKKHQGFSPVAWSYDNVSCVVGTLDAVVAEAPSLIINGHIDVVPCTPHHMWSHPPFEARVAAGEGGKEWIFGRGAGDMKGGIVGAIGGLLALRALGYRPSGRLHFEAVPEEENTGNGALACRVRGYTADAAVIPEPFADVMSTAQCGVMWMTVRLEGKPAHVLDTTQGTSAIQAAYTVFEALRTWEREQNSEEERAKHPPYEKVARPINVNLGRIEGGNWASSVASFCEAEFRVGVYPGHPLADMRKFLEDLVHRTVTPLGVSAKIIWKGFQADGFVADDSHPLFKKLSESFHDATGREASLSPLTCTTDARMFHFRGIPVTCFGPKALRIHGVDECVLVDSMLEIAVTYALFIQRWSGLTKL